MTRREDSWQRAVWIAAPVVLLGIAVIVGFSVPDEGSPLTARDVAEEAGIQDQTQTHGKNCVEDLDGDGQLDLILSRHAEDAWPLYEGKPGGRFVLDTDVEFARIDRHGCAVADFDRDGLLDVYMSVGGCRGECESNKQLWMRQVDGSFVDQAERWGVDDPGARGRVPLVIDANGDDLPDLFTGAATGIEFASPNRWYINSGDHFEVQDDDLAREVGNHCAAAADLDGDGLDEVAVCTPENGFFLYRNTGGAYTEDAAGFGVPSYGRRAVSFADLDDDGDMDALLVASRQLELYLNDGGTFTSAGVIEADDPRDVAVGDANGDGHLDIYLLQGPDTDAADLVFLGDGSGDTFGPGPELPASTGGFGDRVVAIPGWKGTGRTAFLVNNGLNEEPGGPRQLIEFSGG